MGDFEYLETEKKIIEIFQEADVFDIDKDV